jgi:hypothetical protein
VKHTGFFCNPVPWGGVSLFYERKISPYRWGSYFTDAQALLGHLDYRSSGFGKRSRASKKAIPKPELGNQTREFNALVYKDALIFGRKSL